MKQRMGPLCLILCLILSACAVQDGETEYRGSLPARAAQIEDNAVLLAVNDREIPAWRYLYWLVRACERGGNPPGEAEKEQALSDTALYAAVENFAEQYGLSLTDEDTAAVSERWRKQCDAFGSEDACLSALSRYGLDRDRAQSLFRAGVLYGKLRQLCGTDSGFSPDDAALDALARETGTVRVDRILLSGENRDAARRKAESFFSQLNGAENQEELFYELEEQGDDHGGPRTPDQWDEKLSQVARALNIGQVSGIIETDEGFSILRRLPPDRDELLDIWLDRTLEAAASGAEITLSEEYRALDAASFAQTLTELYNAPVE